MDATAIINAITDLRDRAERAEALLADERNRVANLVRELAARPVVSEETVQAIIEELWSRVATDQNVRDVLRRHLLPATPQPVPEGVWWREDIKQFFVLNGGLGVRPSSEFVRTWYDRRHEFPQSREEAERRAKPESIPVGVWWDEKNGMFVHEAGLVYTPSSSSFHEKWYASRESFPKWEREAGR